MTRALRAAAATVAVAAVLPASAQAASGKSISRALDRAGTLTERAVSLAERDADRRAAKTLRQARRTVSQASRDARRLAAKAKTTNRRLDAAAALALVATRLGEDVETYATALPKTDGSAQTALAGALPGSVASHDAIIDALEALVARLPSEHAATVEQVIAALVAKWPEQLDALAGAAALDDLPTTVTGIVERALAVATTALREALGTVQTVVGTLPEPAQQAIGQVLATVQPLLDNVLGIVDEVSKLVTTQLGSVLDMVKELVGGLLPQVTGTVPAGDDSEGETGSTGLLGGLFDGIPLVGGLLSDLLGGLPIVGGLLGGRG